MEMLRATHVNGNSTCPFEVADIDLVLRYIIESLKANLGATQSHLETVGSLLSKHRISDTREYCRRFAEDGQGTLYAQKDLVPDTSNGYEHDDEGEEDNFEDAQDHISLPRHIYTLTPDFRSRSTTVASIVFLKPPIALSAQKPLSSQIYSVNLPGIDSNQLSTFGILHSILHESLRPYLDAYTTQDLESRSYNDAEARTGLSGAKRKLAELELTLLNLQHNTEIPRIEFDLHPLVESTLHKARNERVVPSEKLLPRHEIENNTVLNDLTTYVNIWTKSILTVTNLAFDSECTSAAQEIHLWPALEKALEDIMVKLDSEGVRLTFDILRAGKRHQIGLTFAQDIKLKDAIEISRNYNNLMRDFPLQELHSADTVEKIVLAVRAIFSHFLRKLRGGCEYPIRRSLALTDCISYDFTEQVHRVVNGRTLMAMSFGSFIETARQIQRAWAAWDECRRDYQSTARDIQKKRGAEVVPMKPTEYHIKTKNRLEEVGTFRTNHERLHQSVRTVLGFRSVTRRLFSTRRDQAEGRGMIMDASALKDIEEAFIDIGDVDVLDVSDRGTQLWMQAEQQYIERTARVENSIITQLRDRLATAKSPNEMFRVFSKFHALLVRAKVRGAVAEYQSQLLDSVKQDIALLQERFKAGYANSEAQIMAQLRDVPPEAGSMIWLRQIEVQLDNHLGKVKTVLGEDWSQHTDGGRLYEESQRFRGRLRVQPIFDNWQAAAQRQNLTVVGRIFFVKQARGQSGPIELLVNFDDQTVALFKEVRSMGWLGQPPKHALSLRGREAHEVYPYALSLMESIKTFTATMTAIEEHKDLVQLMSGYVGQAHNLFKKGIALTWTPFIHNEQSLQAQQSINPEPSTMMPVVNAHVNFVRDLAASTTTLQEKFLMLISSDETIQKCFKNLQTCKYTNEAFQANLSTIQNTVDKLNLEIYTGLDFWVAQLNDTLQEILQSRLLEALRVWLKVFRASSDEISLMSRGQADEDVINIAKSFSLEAEITMHNLTIFVDPPVNHIRAQWSYSLELQVDTVCGLQQIQATRYQASAASNIGRKRRVFDVLARNCSQRLLESYESIESSIIELESYLQQWFRYQSLWDLQIDEIQDTLGEDLDLWHQLIQEIRQSRSTFDTSDVRKPLGFIVFDYEQVQARITQKYDQWQHEITTRFGLNLSNRMRETFADLKRARHDLEQQSLEASSTSQAVTFITIVQHCKRQAAIWQPEIEVFRQGQTTLSRQRYNFGSDWLPATQVSDEWDAFSEILARKNKVVDEQTEALRANIVSEDRIIQHKMQEIADQWVEDKPVSGSIAPFEALSILDTFQSRLERLQIDFDTISKAKDALALPASHDDVLQTTFEDVQDFASVWNALAIIWKGIDEQREILWTSLQPRKLRQALDSLMNTAKEMPSKMRQYTAFAHMQNELKKLQKCTSLIADLKTDAVRERHWLKIWKALRPAKRYSEVSLTLGDVWDLNPNINEVVIRDVVVQAQGELALEEFVRSVRDTWQNYSLELVNYQSKLRLIRGWDDLFTKCSENLNSLQAMRHSPYYKEFEEEAASWEDKLNRVHVLFDIWIDVQRQWVYLEGVFTGNNDIKHLLPTESSRFSNINAEFNAIMKKVYKSPLVMDVLAIPGVQKALDRLAELLIKIQKALGEYLERERVSFPRFYFVGDEDLLEIIGNSNDTNRVSKHFKKMFAGIAGVEVNDDNTITAITSKEDELVVLRKEISLTKVPKINDWLTALDLSSKLTLADLLAEAVEDFDPIFTADQLDVAEFMNFLEAYPAQIVILAAQVVWTDLVEECLIKAGEGLGEVLQYELRLLDLLAESVLQELSVLSRKKCEHLITEAVHQRDTISKLIHYEANSPGHYVWLLQMRYVYRKSAEPLERLHIEMANARLEYGWEYLGVPDRLVRTPLTDRCFLTLTQALCQRLGGSPYGPAGTGKTESVKALGLQLGRFTLVFCCDDTFDFQAMGRIFLGICQVGAWGCFDEFNRLEERILSAVSQQIQNIQTGLKNTTHEAKAQVELVGRRFKVNPNTGTFITMNPGYAGRSNLPDNLKKLFRSVAMSKPDKELIAEVMLFSQGFKQAKKISKQVVPFFDHAAAKLSRQPHYDFGLRALKSVLVSSGSLKRTRLQKHNNISDDDDVLEPQILVQSIRETVAPKLIKDDVSKLIQVQEEDFIGVDYIPADLTDLRNAIEEVMVERRLTISDAWMTKILQLYQIQKIHHGVMMVGQSASGKSEIWNVLLRALQKVEEVEGVSYVIDPKVMSKESLYGHLDSTTREWTDGLFTATLRKIVDNLRGEDSKRHWIVFDGDVDPEWIENLNSVLDDNKLLTLPNGERLNLPPNVRIMFEVESLKHATLATVSRCGMVWFNEDTVTAELMIDHYLAEFEVKSFEDLEDEFNLTSSSGLSAVQVQVLAAEILRTLTKRDDFMLKALHQASRQKHIMEFTIARALDSFFCLISKALRAILQYNIDHSDFILDEGQIERFMSRKFLIALVWAFVGDATLDVRKEFGSFIVNMTNVEVPNLDADTSLIDYDISLPHSQWVPWQSQVPVIDVATHAITQTDVIIPTVDTVRHEEVLYSWLAEHKPLMLCGPPGSGKTMTLFSALRKLPEMEVVGLNFSSATMPELIIKTFEQYCEYRKTLNGIIMSPTQVGKWLVIFCDEINLPVPDRYNTQRVVSLMRQLIEQNGFYRTTDKAWVSLERIQFVGACNPPEDAGRYPLGARFLRHAPVVMVDYPGQLSLTQIYGTFNNAVLKVIPTLRGYGDVLTKAMVDFFLRSQAKFTAKIQPHYVYSPRELTRWVRGVYESIAPLEHLSLEGLVRIWAHEALRLFADRLVEPSERMWTTDLVRTIALENFPTADIDTALQGPILFSNWLSKHYISVEQEVLRDFVKARLRTFCEEEVDVPLVLFNDVLEHSLRIDRVFRQPQGHLILIGTSGSGKTTLSRFVAWMNGLKVFQIKVHRKYSAEDFDEDLRHVLRACGTKGEKICFIMDESNVLDSGFLERMNTLLANGEVPGLFEGDEYSALMTACKEGAQKQGLLLDSQEELYKWFTQQIVRNLHVVFTMNPPQEGLSSKAATSPALFNRCVLNWMGDWSDQALFQVGYELSQSMDLDQNNFQAPDSLPVAYSELTLPASHRDTIINSMVYIHHSIHEINQVLQRQQGIVTYLTPRHYLDFVHQFRSLFDEKRGELEDQQRHLNVGLEKLRDTVDKVRDLRVSLAEKQEQLTQKDAEANEKLQRMVADQQEAESKKTGSLELKEFLARQDTKIAERTAIVREDLAQAEPAVQEASRSVGNIKRPMLNEVRSMANPPRGVKLALEAVCALLGHRATEWKDVRAISQKDDFIATIVNYNNELQMTPALRIKMRKDYLSSEDFTYEKVNRASKACGPLVNWVTAQVNYSEILDRVGPLRAEVEKLEEDALDTRAQAKATEQMIAQLESSIAVYKEEYAVLISQTQAIKTEMTQVQQKVDRSVRLLDSLSSERTRWEASSKSFDTQIQTLVGDALIAAAFLAYAGLYDQQFRSNMTEDWLYQLRQSGIACKTEGSVLGYLSTADERLKWQRNNLPADDLCIENAIMLKRYNRYPLIVDPSNRIADFLRQEYQDRKLTVTSFLDESFVKQLESALRFGNPILIQDAEHIDPILTHVLNKEYQRTGGRVLIQLGKQEIDFSPSFKLYLSSRDPSARFAPDVCSRTTLVNFTVTRSSLQSQSLDDVLKAERPDVDKRRTNLIKMQGDFNTTLRQLEHRLLTALNESRGNILDDDNVIHTLETLKKEAAVITRKVQETSGVMAEVERITLDYSKIAAACSAVFTVLELLYHVNHIYRFSLQYFIDIFHSVLHNNDKLRSVTDFATRSNIILKDIFVETYQRTAISLYQKDRITFAILLVRASPYSFDRGLLDAVLESGQLADQGHQDLAGSIRAISTFASVKIDISDETWRRFLSSEQAERNVPILKEASNQIDRRLFDLLIVKKARPDRFLPAAEQLVSAVFGTEILEISESLELVVKQISAGTAVALMSDPGFDASYKVDQLVERTNITCTNVAMGSEESISSADKAISSATTNGSWVLIKNVHLAPRWLQTLEKKLTSLRPHQDFRLFLSMEASVKIPVNLIRAARSMVFEQPAGIRANMKDTLGVLSHRGSRAPIEKDRLYLLLCFLHAVLQERLRYAPTLGWKSLWEFNDSDYECCAFIIDSWVERMAQGRTNVAPVKLPWDLIRNLITEMYGGKIDDEGDFALLRGLVNQVFDPHAYEDDHELVHVNDEEGLRVPSGTSMKEFSSWIDTLPEREPPVYLGLPSDADRLLLFGRGRETLSSLANIVSKLEENERVGEEGQEERRATEV